MSVLILIQLGLILLIGQRAHSEGIKRTLWGVESPAPLRRNGLERGLGRRESRPSSRECSMGASMELSSRPLSPAGHERGKDQEDVAGQVEEEVEDEYVLLDLEDVFHGATLPPNCPYTLSVN